MLLPVVVVFLLWPFSTHLDMNGAEIDDVVDTPPTKTDLSPPAASNGRDEVTEVRMKKSHHIFFFCHRISLSLFALESIFKLNYQL